MRLIGAAPTGDSVRPWLGLTQPWATILAALAVLASAAITFWVASLARGQREKHWQAENRQSRFTGIAGQLADPSAAVRIAGVYAMEALIDDWLEPSSTVWWSRLVPRVRKKIRQEGLRKAQACVNVLCAYLRLPTNTHPGGDPSLTKQIVTSTRGRTGVGPQGNLIEQHHEYLRDDQEVRDSILRTIAAHLRDDPPGRPWVELDYDFTGAIIKEVDFTQASFAGKKLDFTGAVLDGTGASFSGATFSAETVFDGATFRAGAFFTAASFFGTTSFRNATFHKDVSFVGARFLGLMSFVSATFLGESTSFRAASFGGRAPLFQGGGTFFLGTRFEGAWVDFINPAKWTDVAFDWKPPQYPKPSNVLPHLWPPKLAENSDTVRNEIIGALGKEGPKEHAKLLRVIDSTR